MLLSPLHYLPSKNASVVGLSRSKIFGRKNVYTEKQWVLRHVELQRVLRLGNAFLQICLLFSPGLIQSQYTGVLWRKRTCVQWSLWLLLQYCGMLYSALCPWPWFAGARETWVPGWPIRNLSTKFGHETQRHTVLPLDNEALGAWELSMVLSVVRKHRE